MGHSLDTYLPIIAAVATTAAGFPEFAPVAAGVTKGATNYSQTHNFGDAAKAGALSAGGSFIGANVGSALLPDMGTIGGTFLGSGTSSDIASALGSGAGNVLGTPIASALGGYAGNSLASSFAPSAPPSQRGLYEPQMASLGNMPASLNQMSSLTPQQQASSLATQGVYGGGLGPQEQGYFKNLVNNQIVGGENPNAIENSYLSNLGFGNQGSNYNLAKALSQWNPTS